MRDFSSLYLTFSHEVIVIGTVIFLPTHRPFGVVGMNGMDRREDYIGGFRKDGGEGSFWMIYLIFFLVRSYLGS